MRYIKSSITVNVRWIFMVSSKCFCKPFNIIFFLKDLVQFSAFHIGYRVSTVSF